MERKQVGLRVSPGFLAQLDEVRGGVPREAWMRAALMAAVKQALIDKPILAEDQFPDDPRTEPAVAAS